MRNRTDGAHCPNGPFNFGLISNNHKCLTVVTLVSLFIFINVNEILEAADVMPKKLSKDPAQFNTDRPSALG